MYKRVPYIVGNWKMNTLLEDARLLATALKQQLSCQGVADIGIAPPFVYLQELSRVLAGSKIQLGAQDVYGESAGAFTGEVSPAMLRDVGCEFVIVGHSERRQLVGETGPLLRKKLEAAIQAGLKVIYCVGETSQQRQDQQTFEVIGSQLADVLEGELDWKRLTIAYEPVWAIGTGVHARVEQAQEVHQFVRDRLAKKFGESASQSMRIQYGGSVKAANAGELLSAPDIDGALVGGASLKADEFCAIVKSCKIESEQTV